MNFDSALIQKAWADGADYAKGLTVGNVFQGALPDADDAGYGEPSATATPEQAANATVARSIFVTAYLANLPRNIRCERGSNVIVSCER